MDDETAYLKSGTFSFWNSDFKWQPYLEGVFQELKSKPLITNLVIDLRGNEGGNGDIRDAVLSYITTKPITGESEARICYSALQAAEKLLPSLSTWDKSFKQPKNEADFVQNEIGLDERKQVDAADIIKSKSRPLEG